MEPEVTLDHGEGGEATCRFIRDEILTRFGNPILNTLEDGSWLPWNHPNVVISTDSFIVEPPVFPGGDIGTLAVSGTVNDLLAAGAAPQFLTLSLILGERLPFSLLRGVLDSIRRTAESARVQIVAGDTKVLPARTGLKILINTTGVGTPIRPGESYAVSQARPGDQVLVTGTMGDHGLAVLSFREGLGFEARVVSDCAPLHGLIGPVLAQCSGVHCLRDPSRGGLMGVLADIAESSNVDIEIDAAAVPIQREVRFGCEMLGLDPLLLPNEGKFVLVVDPGSVLDVLVCLRKHPLGAAARAIGAVNKARSPQGGTYLRGQNGLRKILRPAGMPLPRLC
jgi:hydrogenase expression/formation protein HypE